MAPIWDRTRLRVSISKTSLRQSSCADGTIGEVEDYPLVVGTDSVSPTIVIKGKAIDTLEVYTGWVDPGYAAWDAAYGNLNSSVTIKGKVDTAKLGTYKLTYTATDGAGNKAKASRTVYVLDRTAPLIQLNGADTVFIDVYTSYTDSGIVVIDNYDQFPKVTGNISIDTTKLDTFEWYWCAEDQSGNKSKCISRYIIVQDTTSPSIMLVGADTVTLEVFSAYQEPGVTITDNFYRNLQPIIKSSLDTARLGIYSISYCVSDSSGNGPVCVQRFVEVIDTEQPKIELNGPDTIWLPVFSSYIEPGATYSDNYDSSLNLIIHGKVDTAVIGTYLLSYCVTDNSGNGPVCIPRYVEVIDTIKPTIQLNGADTIWLPVFGNYVEEGATASDNYDSTISYTTTSNLDESSLGEYTIRYCARDASLNGPVCVERTIMVYDSVAPTITLLGNLLDSSARWKQYIEPGFLVSDNYYDSAELTITRLDSINIESVGLYTIHYSASDPSGNQSGVVVRQVQVYQDSTNSIQDKSEHLVSIFPNPTNGQLVVSVVAEFELKRIALFSNSGQLKQETRNGVLEDRRQLNLLGLPNGIYILEIEGKHELVRKRVVLSQ